MGDLPELPLRIVLVERKTKSKIEERGQGEHDIYLAHGLTTVELYQHDRADQSFFRKWSLTQFFNTPSAR